MSQAELFTRNQHNHFKKKKKKRKNTHNSGPEEELITQQKQEGKCQEKHYGTKDVALGRGKGKVGRGEEVKKGEMPRGVTVCI